MIETGTKKYLIEQYMTELLGLELGKKYIKILEESVTNSSYSSIYNFLKYFSDEKVLECLEEDIARYVVVVNDTRLARKMYPDYNIRGDGKLIIEINSPE